MNERKSGYYWLKINDWEKHRIGFWDNLNWVICGDEEYYPDDYFDEINETPLTPPEN